MLITDSLTWEQGRNWEFLFRIEKKKCNSQFNPLLGLGLIATAVADRCHWCVGHGRR